MLSPKPARESAYQRLAGVLEKMIREQTLACGARLPSVRQFSLQQRVSVPTALQAYATLEAQGLIEARPKSGFYVRSLPKQTARTKQHGVRFPKVTDLAGLEALDPIDVMMNDNSDAPLASMGEARPGDDLAPPARLTQILGSLARKLGPKSGAYDWPPGAESLRQEIARRSLHQGCNFSAGDLIITNGGTEAVSLALRTLCDPGDTVVVESPTYFGFLQMLRELRLNALPIPVRGNSGLDLDLLEASLKRARVTAALLNPNFHNPSGCVMPEENKRRVVSLFAEHGVAIIEDDICGDLPHQGPRPYCLKAYDRSETVLLCGAFSKTLAPGYRVGYLAPGVHYKRALGLKRVSSLASATLTTLAIAEFLKNGGYERFLRTTRQIYKQRIAQVRQAIATHFPPTARCSAPSGGFVLWCELPENVDAIRLFKKALAAGIAIAPGPLFSTGGEFRHCIRLNCSHPYTAKTERGIKVLGELIWEAPKTL